MTIRFNLMVGMLTSRTGVEALTSEITQNIGQLFRDASAQDIDLRIVKHGLLAQGIHAGPLPSDTLHRALEGMTGKQRDGAKVTNIGLLIADSFEPAPSFFGLMFDDAFQPGSSDPWQRTAREGCAVFLDGIDGKRAASERVEEAIFTAVHELAHVFNLQHSPAPSFLYQSAGGNLLRPDQAAFTSHECQLLSRCSTSRFIHPGGSGFGDLGDLAVSVKNANPANGAPVELKIKPSKDAFWQFEPVELDVSLHAALRRVTVPDALDVGYTGFDIWIADPTGERRRLRSPRHYCSPRGKLTVNPGSPFQRDISIFGESGSYTFRRAGIHCLWIVFEYAKGRSIQSNTVEVEVLPQRVKSPIWLDAAPLFTHRDVAQLMYFRRLTPKRQRTLKQLSDFCDTHSRHPMSAMAHYAMGRALGCAVLERSSPNAVLSRSAKHHLTQAARKSSLGDYRKQKVEQVLEEISGGCR